MNGKMARNATTRPKLSSNCFTHGVDLLTCPLRWPAPSRPIAQLVGQQRRLRLLGYQLGHDGGDGDGIDNALGYRAERSILDFQAGSGLQIDAVVGPSTRNKLKTVAGG